MSIFQSKLFILLIFINTVKCKFIQDCAIQSVSISFCTAQVDILCLDLHSLNFLSLGQRCLFCFPSISFYRMHPSSIPDLTPEQQKLLIELRRKKQELLLEIQVSGHLISSKLLFFFYVKWNTLRTLLNSHYCRQCISTARVLINFSCGCCHRVKHKKKIVYLTQLFRCGNI